MSDKLAIFLTLGIAAGSVSLRSQEVSKYSFLSTNQRDGEAASEAALSAFSKSHPKNAEPLARLGLMKARRGQYSQAIEFYRRAMALKPTLPGLRLNLGLALFKDTQYQEALATFGPLLNQPSSSPSEMQRLNLLIGMSHYGLGEYEAAVPYLRHAVDLDAQNLPLLLALAHSCLLSKQYQCVLESYHRMIAQNADSAEADMLVGEALDEMQDTAGAVQEFRAAIQQNPKEPNAHFGLGYLLWTQLQYEEAAHEFKAELENTPDYTQAQLYLADTEIRVNQVQEARALLEKLVKSNPEIPMGHLDLGIVYADAGRNQDALRELRMAAALKPDDVKVHMRLRQLYRSMGMVTEAKTEADLASNLNKASHEPLSNVISSTPATSPHK